MRTQISCEDSGFLEDPDYRRIALACIQSDHHDFSAKKSKAFKQIRWVEVV